MKTILVCPHYRPPKLPPTNYSKSRFNVAWDITMLTVRVRRTPDHTFCQEVLLGSFSRFFLASCSCFFTFCFRLLSLSFLPLSPIAYLLILSKRIRTFMISTVTPYFNLKYRKWIPLFLSSSPFLYQQGTLLNPYVHSPKIQSIYISQILRKC